jgi:hypothetical protein
VVSRVMLLRAIICRRCAGWFAGALCLYLAGVATARGDHFHREYDGPPSPIAGAPSEAAGTSVNAAADSVLSPDPPRRVDAFWSELPATRGFPRPGNFPAPSTGPGYYSARDWLEGNWRESPPPLPYPPFALMPLSFFDANWRFLDDPAKSWGLTDHWKRRELGCRWLGSTGGSFWWRYMNETNSRAAGVNQDYDLIRTRVYADLSYLDRLRVYGEMIDAHRLGGELAPLAIDENPTDLVNGFVDFNSTLELAGEPLWVRVGRQELLFGSQRLLSSLEWANTRRTFDGVRVMRGGPQWDFDAFWAQFVRPDPTRFDRADPNQNLAGAWATYKPRPGHFLDLYYLYYGHTNPPPQPLAADASHVHTLGSRYAGDRDNWRWDVEAAWQFGERDQADISAGMATVGLGYLFVCVPARPLLWAYYDWASGDRAPGAGKHGTFHQIFPFGHYYLGWADIVGRQNVQDFNLHLFLHPANWVTVWLQYHHLNLDSAADALYNPGGLAIRRDATGQSGRHVGDELDIVLNFHLGPHSDLLVGWSKLYAGEFFRATGPDQSPELAYVQYNFRW